MESFHDTAADPFEDVARDRAHDRNRKFVPAEAVAQRIVAAEFDQPVAAKLEHHVADRMAVGVVDLLEPVEIDQGYCHFAARPRPARHIAVQRPAVGQAAEAVGQAEMFEPVDARHADPAEQEEGQQVERDAGDDHRPHRQHRCLQAKGEKQDDEAEDEGNPAQRQHHQLPGRPFLRIECRNEPHHALGQDRSALSTLDIGLRGKR